MINAHLNGGPRDDEYMVVPSPELRVVLFRQNFNFGLTHDENPTLSAGTGEGLYVMRRDSLGEPVPHNLEGWVEFDYRMDRVVWRDGI